MANNDIVLTVSERESHNGIFDCHHDGRYLCSSPSPFIDGCRHLLARGYDPAARVVMRHSGFDDDALSGVLARVAGVEVGSHGVGFRPRRKELETSPPSIAPEPQPPIHGHAQRATASPMRSPLLGATTLATSC